jgi:hypothetical protein
MTISSTNRKAGPYIGNGTASVFPFYFKVFTAADVEVVKLTVATNVETTLALTTDYTVSLNTDQNANPGGSITLVAGVLATGFNLVVTSDIGNLQPTDLTNQGGFYPDVINDALDRATIQIQQLQEAVDRAALLPITSDTDAAALVADIERLASSADNLDIDANNISAINTVATNITNVNTVATNITNVNAVAGNNTNITAVAGNSTNINAVNSNKTNIDTVAGNNANVTTVAGISANVTSVAGNATNINAVAGNATNINAVNANSTNINAVNSNSSNINTVAGSNTAVTTVATNITAVNSAYTNLAAILDAPTQASNAANSAAQAAASAASGMYSAVQDKSANYTIVAGDAGDLIRVTTTSGAVTITLPLISSVGDGFKIAIVKWTSDANAVNIARSGSNTINGATSAQIGSQYSQIILVADGETGTWFASQSGLGATNVNIDNFSGNGSTTAFTLTSDPSTENNTSVFISGVYQQKNTYSVSGTTLTFSTAPPTGTTNIEVAYSTPLAIGTPSDGTVTTAKIVDGNVTAAKLGSDAPLGVSDKLNSSTGYFDLPSGTTAQRPGSPVAGMIRYNSTTGFSEIYQGGVWNAMTFNYLIQYLTVAGGGGGGSSFAGGGGAGGLVTSTLLAAVGNVLTISVGGGGAGGTQVSGTDGNAGSNGSNSSITGTTTAVGGGGGGGYIASNLSTTNGRSGGSGGGACYNGTIGSGTSLQGNAGGLGANTVNQPGGGGGGASAAGSAATTTVGGAGGAGAASTISGSSVTYAGGGGGGTYNGGTVGTGGTGGGGAGSNTTATATAGTTNRGGGGGGGYASTTTAYAGGNGGSGVVILSIPTQNYSGTFTGSPTVTTSGANTILTFTSSGSYTA